jgi:hypothetical protein
MRAGSPIASVFAAFQPEDAARGIPTFPFASNIEHKKPLIRAFDKVGLRASAQLALRFPDAPGLATMAGQGRVKLTIADVDATGAEGERLLGDVQRQFGRPKVIARTGRGGFHGYYRHNGEARRIRPDPRMPIDILGGGVVVLPPSRGLYSTYEFIEGTIDDLTSLTKMRAEHQAPNALKNLADVRVGQRDAVLWKYIAREAQHTRSYKDLLETAQQWNEMITEPLTDAEIEAKCRYWWDKTAKGENRFGVGRHFVTEHTLVDNLLMKSVDAFVLLNILRRKSLGSRVFPSQRNAQTYAGGRLAARAFCFRPPTGDRGWSRLGCQASHATDSDALPVVKYRFGHKREYEERLRMCLLSYWCATRIPAWARFDAGAVR